MKLIDRLIKLFKTEIVLTVSIVAAVVSAFFVPPSFNYFSYIDYKVLLCLFCLMIVVSGFKKVQVFEAAASLVVSKSRNLRQLSFGIIALTYFLAMFMTNDVALITLVPFALIVLDKVDGNDYAILVIVLQTIAANIGSSLTPIGNPQNLFIYSRYDIQLQEFLIILLPIVFAGGVLVSLSVFSIEKRSITISEEQPDFQVDKKGALVYSLLFILSILGVFRVVPIIPASIILALCVLITDRRLFREVDYSLLITFIGFFIFVGNLSEMESVKLFLSGILTKGALMVSILSSQVISNVPAAVLLSSFTNDYKGLLLGVNVGGLGTIIASLASVISFKLYTKAHRAHSKKYLKVFTCFNVLFLVVLIAVACFETYL